MSQNVPFSVYLRRLEIGQRITGKKRVPYKKFAKEYEVSERAIKRDVHWIRQNSDIPTVQKVVVEKVLKALEDCDNEEDKELILRYGLPFLARGIPQKIEAKEETRVYKEYAVSITSNLSEYDRAVEEELTRIFKTNRTGQPVDSRDT